MKDFRYLEGLSSLTLDRESCIGCTMCTQVCPHGVFVMEHGKARITDLDGCMECGACARNCPVGALSVTPGVGCAAYIVQKWLGKKEGACC